MTNRAEEAREGLRSIWTPDGPKGREGTSGSAASFIKPCYTINWMGYGDLHLRGLTPIRTPMRTASCVGGGFNMARAQHMETGRGAKLRSPDVVHTSNTGRGRVIDFALIPNTLPLFWFREVNAAPQQDVAVVSEAHGKVAIHRTCGARSHGRRRCPRLTRTSMSCRTFVIRGARRQRSGRASAGARSEAGTSVDSKHRERSASGGGGA